MAYTAVIARSGAWRVIRREGEFAFVIQCNGKDEVRTDAGDLRSALRRRSLGIPHEDARNILADLGPPLAFSGGRDRRGESPFRATSELTR